jgi:hypothetical protein
MELLSDWELDRLHVEFIGENSSDIAAVVRSFPRVMRRVQTFPIVPYDQAIRLISTADCLLISQTWDGSAAASAGVVTTKLMEYLGARRPIIGDLAPDTEAARILKSSGLGLECSQDSTELAAALRTLITGTFSLRPNEPFIESFSRTAQTRALIELANELRRK